MSKGYRPEARGYLIYSSPPQLTHKSSPGLGVVRRPGITSPYFHFTSQ